MVEEVDPDTGIVRKFISAVTGAYVPRIIISGKEYLLPVGAMIMVSENANVVPGDTIATFARKATKNQDITEGLTRVLQVLEVRKLIDKAIVAEIDGEFKIKQVKGKHLLAEILGPRGEVNELMVSIEKQLNVYDGDLVKAGDILAEGTIDPRDILVVGGKYKAASFMIDEIQKVYRAQGVAIDDKHFEIVLMKMLRKVQITDPGSSSFVVDEIVDQNVFWDVNDRAVGRKAVARPLLLSLTKAALYSESWLSSASFQETTSELAEAAIRKKKDYLYGSKENIITGRMVPLGTGHEQYRRTILVRDEGVRNPASSRKSREIYERFMGLFKE
jgi:DNA-directed RNA polymerase subunit beta'